jgi:class 3 adenylate cyclase
MNNSITDSMSTLDDEDPVNNTPYHYPMDNINPYFTCERQKTDEDSYISQTERHFKGKEYESGYDTILELATDYNASLHLLRRTRVVSALAHRLIAAPDEAACIEEVTKLMALVFGLDRVSFAMSTGSDHFVLKRIEVKRKKREENGNDDDSSFDLSDESPLLELEYKDSDFKRPYEGTAAGVVAKTLREHYTPRTQHSHFATHRVFYSQGLNSVLASPILVHGDQCMGVILLSKKEEDAFPKLDRILISDIGTLLGANIYAKRLRKASEDANKLSREMLHSFVPPKVLQKIECFWDSSSAEYKKLKSSLNSTTSISPESSVCNKPSEKEMIKTNSWYVANTDWSEAQIEEHVSRLKKNDLEGKLEMLKKLNRAESFKEQDVIITTKGLDLDAELSMTSRALYAETVSNVTIIFTDIVGFSRIAMGVTPIRVMNMLQNLFSRFDQLCDVHGVMKLETIGDAYICATNLLEEDADDVNVARNAAQRALAMAKDMIFEAGNVQVPISHDAAQLSWESHSNDAVEKLKIRVGIHVGDITCGVLGQRVPKFTLCGTSVNMAARMEQTSKPNHIRATQNFHDLIGNNEMGWQEKETVAIKNMGEVDTYLLNPYNSTLSTNIL